MYRKREGVFIGHDKGIKMDNQVWDLDFTYNGPQSTKISCHSGDFGSRAMCNMIGDQPLFYIEDSVEEDALSLDEMMMGDDLGFGAHDEKMLDEMRNKIKSYEKSAKLLSAIEITSPEQEFDLFLKNETTTLSLDNLIQFAGKSNNFNAYYNFIMANNIKISLTDTVESAFYDRETSCIMLNKNLNMNGAIMALMKSMRMAWTHKQGVLINPLAFQPEEAVLVNRIQAADSDIAIVAMLWDMKLAGETALWNNAMVGGYYDLCAAYAMEAMTDFRSIKSGLAARAAFEKWFISGRCKSYDRDIIQVMLGKHSDIQIGHQDASRTVALDLIGSMGKRPEGQNYLSSIAVQIMNDGMYGDVRDRSNANFLWFVTFERRMAEMEQKLQGDESTEEKLVENVISLPQNNADKTTNDTDTTASLFFLDHFRAG